MTRKEMLDILKELAKEDFGYPLGNDAIQMAIQALSQKSGKWIKDAYVTMPYVCSECGCFYNLKHRNYCPNCGAKMESEEEK